MPSPTAPVKQHEAFLEETKSLLHPGNFQVALIDHFLDMDGVANTWKFACLRCLWVIFVISIIFGHLLTRRKRTHTCVCLFVESVVPIQTQVVITKRLLSQLYGQTDAALNSLSSTLLARQAVSQNICLNLQILFLIASLDHFRKAKLCTELLQTVAKVDSGFSQFRLEKPRFQEF